MKRLSFIWSGKGMFFHSTFAAEKEEDDSDHGLAEEVVFDQTTQWLKMENKKSKCELPRSKVLHGGDWLAKYFMDFEVLHMANS